MNVPSPFQHLLWGALLLSLSHLPTLLRPGTEHLNELGCLPELSPAAFCVQTATALTEDIVRLI